MASTAVLFFPLFVEISNEQMKEKKHTQIIPNEIILLNIIFGMEFCFGQTTEEKKTMKTNDKKRKKKHSTNVHFVKEWNKDKTMAVTS